MEDAVQWSSVAVLLQIKFVLKERLFTSSSCIPFPFFPLTLQSLHWLSSLIVTLLLTHYVEELVGVEKGKSILLGQLQQWPVCLGNMHNEITVVSSLLEELGSEIFRFQAYFSTAQFSQELWQLFRQNLHLQEREALPLPLVFEGLSRVPVLI